jgi:hypothetical protein
MARERDFPPSCHIKPHSNGKLTEKIKPTRIAPDPNMISEAPLIRWNMIIV